jgi:predicted ATPase
MERVLCPILIGRDEELSRLEDALLSANNGEGQVVLVAGDAGMGKTRLASELGERALRQGMSVLLGGCSEAQLALPYLPFLEAVGNHLAASDLETVRERLGPVRRELAHLFPQLEPEAVAPDVESTQGRFRLFEAMLALLRIPAEETGLLVVIEDLHWADASTRELLEYLTRRLPSSRILVLGTYRREELNRRHPLLPMIQNWAAGELGDGRRSGAALAGGGRRDGHRDLRRADRGRHPRLPPRPHRGQPLCPRGDAEGGA